NGSLDELESRVRPETAAGLGRRAAVREDDVGGEVVRAADQRRADAVGINGNAPLLELADLLRGEAAGDDDLDPLEAVSIERVAHVPHQAFADAGRLEVAELVPERAVDERLRRVEPDTPEPGPEGT